MEIECSLPHDTCELSTCTCTYIRTHTCELSCSVLSKDSRTLTRITLLLKFTLLTLDMDFPLLHNTHTHQCTHQGTHFATHMYIVCIQMLVHTCLHAHRHTHTHACTPKCMHAYARIIVVTWRYKMHEMHGPVNVNDCHVTDLFIHDPLSSSGYLYSRLISDKLLIKTFWLLDNYNHIMYTHTISLQTLKTNQFSVTKHKKVAKAVHGETGLPGM